MATVPTQVRIDEATKKEAAEILEGLGMSLSEAMNIFLRQVVLRRRIPFDVSYPEYKLEVIEAMEEAKRISRDPNVKGYTDVKQMFKEILEEDA